MPISPAPREEAGPPRSTRGERTRAAVLAAARDHFASEGYDGATGARIAADAGVSEPTIAFHFGNKAGLLIAVMRGYYDDLLERIDDVVHAASDPSARLQEFARFWLTHNAAHHDLVAVFGRRGRRRPVDEIGAAFRAANRRVTRGFERLIDDLKHAGVVRDDVATRSVRDAFFGGAEHVLLGRVASGRSGDLSAAADDLVDLLLRGAAAGDGGARASVAARLDEMEDKLDRVLASLERMTSAT